MIGALLDFISHSNPEQFQPMNANFGILPPLDKKIRDKKLRYENYVQRSQQEMSNFSELFL
jgi:methylenetetrahydrofolate--tRNA-(uracil-5-)-methyltransferase